MNDDVIEQVKRLAADWVAAELKSDAAALGQILADDFAAVGPRGFVLSKADWIQRLASGDLKYEALDLGDVAARLYGETVVLIGVSTQKASYQGHDAQGQFRITMIWVNQQGNWKLAGAHLSPMAGPPPGFGGQKQ